MKKLLIFVMLLMLVPIVSAVPPVQVATGDVTLELRYPPYQFIHQNQDFKLHVHVFNKTDGMIMTNATTSCEVHLYNHSGYHTFESGPMAYDANGLEFEVLIDQGNFTQLGDHAFLIQCNTSTIGGFVSGEFEITTDGDEPHPNDFGWIILGMVGIIFVFLITSFKIDSLVLKSLFFFIAMFFVVITLSVIIDLPNASQGVIEIVSIAYMIGVVVTIFSFMFTIIMFIHEALLGKKAEERREEEE